MNKHVPAMQSPALQPNSHPIVSFGPTLARQMTPDDCKTVLDRQPAARLVGTVYVSMVHATVPNVINVEQYMDGIGPASAIVALETAAKRLRVVHQVGPEKLQFHAVDLYDAERMRGRAEEIVDMCRSGRVGVFGGDMRPAYDHSRENCVRAIMAVLASFATNADVTV